MYCPNCGQKTTRRCKFCASCGENLTTQISKKPEKSESRGVPLTYAIAMLGGGMLLGAIIINIDSGRNETVLENIPPAISIHSAPVLDIAREFNCPCGTCDQPLDECECEHKNGALEIKTFIAEKLLERHHKPHIVEMVQEKYGGLKSKSTLPLDAFVKPGESSMKKQ